MSPDLQFWEVTYLTAGLVLLVAGRVLVKLFYKDKRSNFVREMMAAMETEKSTSEKRRKFFKNIAVGALAVAIWPVTFSILVNELRGRESVRTFEVEGVSFNCTNKDLFEIVNPLEVEAMAKVFDPLGRVPDLPFGHLNHGWRVLRRKLRPGDVMWSFKTAGHTPSPERSEHTPRYSGPTNVMSGYAIVRSKKIVAEFLAQWD